MRDVPIRRLMISDFRRIEGTRELPFDAPVVLIHGSNGTGKTSVLSALELALTGEIRSMERQSDRYRAHLPFRGQPYATVQADVANYLQGDAPGSPLTVGGARLEGEPAFQADAANFYAERCYLDQSSLGRLLDLYQARESNEQTALEKFVNELLGLEKLDALRGGLSDANDFRLFKRLAVGVDEADRQAKTAAAQLKDQAVLRAEIRSAVADARASTRAAVIGLDHEYSGEGSDADLLAFVRSAPIRDTVRDELDAAEALRRELIALGGRISALVERPSAQRIEETNLALSTAIANKEAWEATDGVRVRTWETSAETAGVVLTNNPRIAVEQATSSALRELESATEVRARLYVVEASLEAARAEMDAIQNRLEDAHEQSSALVEGLAAIRSTVDGNNRCPVCDRDFAEVSGHSLLAHIDAKLSEVAGHGQQLVDLRNERDQHAGAISRLETEYTQLRSRLLTADQQRAVELRIAALAEVAAELEAIEALKAEGANRLRLEHELQQSLDGLVAAASEEHHIRKELVRYANLLGVPLDSTFHSYREPWSELIERAEARVAQVTERANRAQEAEASAERLAAALDHESDAVRRLAELAEHKKLWDDRVAEGKRRQGVAREVHEAATRARANIVHRVFTQSLNEVWKTVFTRLAPNEGFIPSFGIPSATKKTFDINLETIHRDGEAGGPPQMMLSAGNLNTAALSLFLALHLAVEPLVPCLVFDDPVQAMDEVHVAQFAGLIRLLSKQNDRQVIIAVHERELFDYLTLELSPAYKGDELITIELGERAADEDLGITRHRWTPDASIAM